MKGLKDNKGRFTKNIPVSKICIQCDKEFKPRHNKQKFCSKKCSDISTKKNKNRDCAICKKSFWAQQMKTRFCSQECYGSTLVKEKPIKIKKERVYKRATLICEYCNNNYIVALSRKEKARFCNLKCKGKYFGGERSPHWKENRNEVISNHSRLKQGQYKEWRMTIMKRDNFCCKMKNKLCKGMLQVHHILPWRDYPDVRYNLENGITLCMQHHPRKRIEELKMIDLFRELIKH